MRFLELTAIYHPYYANVISRLKSGETYLDAGCCLGQDIRKLLYDGAPSSAALYGLDLEAPFFDTGYRLFRDKESLLSKSIAVDLTQLELPSIDIVKEGIDIISAQSLFHLFGLEQQELVAKHLVTCSRPKAGSVIIGRQAGDYKGVTSRGFTPDHKIFLHSIDSFTQFWRKIGNMTGSKWDVDVEAKAPEERMLNQAYSTPDIMILVFRLTRVL